MGYQVISLFSGAGGLDLGFEGGFKFLDNEYEKHGFEHVFANDKLERAVETYNHNAERGIFTTKATHGDIKEILDQNSQVIPSGDVVTGGFPCKDFSIAGKRNGLDVERGRLYKYMKRVIELKKPKVFVAENVEGLTTMEGVLDVIKKDFSSIKPSYDVSTHLLNATDYGVPQTRKRLFIVGVRGDQGVTFSPPEPTHASNPLTAKEALKDLEDNQQDSFPLNHDEISGAKNYGEHLQGNTAIEADKPSPTIRSEHHGNIEFHYKLDRRLSVRECARLQSFPDEFEFAGSMSSNYKIVGNAVPPVLGWHIAMQVKKVLQGQSTVNSRASHEKKHGPLFKQEEATKSAN